MAAHRCFHIFAFALCCVLRARAAPRFLVEPVNATVQLHESATFRCTVTSGGNGTAIVSWNRQETSGERTQLTMANSVLKKWLGRLRIENGNLVIVNVTRQLAGRYECSLPLQGLSRVAELVVIADPDYVLIETKPAGPILEGTNVSFLCASHGGFPTAQFAWKTSTGSSFAGPLHIATSPDAYSWTNASFFHTVSAEDHAATVQCTVTNPYTNVSRTASLTLNVLYSPKVAALGALRSIVENSSLTLECNATANPANITYQWHVPDTYRLPCTAAGMQSRCSERILSIPAADRSASGMFACEASNGLFGGRKARATWNITILRPPTVLLEETYIFREHSAMSLRCFNSTEATHTVTSIDEIRWTYGQSSTPIGDQAVFNRTAVRELTGRYECFVRVQLTPSDGSGPSETRIIQKSAQVVVQYLPGKPQMSHLFDQNILNIRVGNRLRVTCTLPINEVGEPPAVIEWTSSKSNFTRVIAVGNTLEVVSTEFTDEGLYRCTPVNAVGRGTYSSVNVKIIGAIFQKTLPPLISKRAKDSLQPGYEPFKLECSLCTQPAMTVSWTHNDIIIATNSQLYEIRTENNNDGSEACRNLVRSVLYFSGRDRPARNTLQITDSGSYMCIASFGSERFVNSSTYLELKHQPVIESKDRYFHAKPNQSVSLECIAHGFPFPEVAWYRSNRTIRDDVTIDLGGQIKTRSRLRIERVTEVDYGTYMCSAINEEGHDSGTITLRRAGLPGVPSNLRASDITWESIRLEWDSDDDGGSKQHFTVIYTSHDSQKVETKTNVTFDKFFVISSLTPNRKYSFRVIPSNIYGDGHSSRNVSFQTEELILPNIAKPLYRESSKTLYVSANPTMATNVSYCLRIEYFFSNHVNDGAGWRPITQCLNWRVNQERVHIEIPQWMLSSRKETDDLRMCICVAHRTEVCGAPMLIMATSAASIASESAPRWVLYVAASICAAIVVGLICMLILCCYCRRKHAQRRLQKQRTANGSCSYVKSDRTKADLMLTAADDAMDDQLALSQAPLRRLAHAIPGLDLQNCNTYVCVDNTDVHPAQLGIMPHSITPLRHLAEMPLSSADTSDTSVSMLPRDALQHRFDDVSAQHVQLNDNYLSMVNQTGLNHKCNHQVPAGMMCNCAEMQHLMKTGQTLHGDYEDASCGNEIPVTENMPNNRLHGCSEQSWPNSTLSTRQMHNSENRLHSFNAHYMMNKPTSNPVSNATLPAHSSAYRSPNDQVFEVIV